MNLIQFGVQARNSPFLRLPSPRRCLPYLSCLFHSLSIPLSLSLSRSLSFSLFCRHELCVAVNTMCLQCVTIIVCCVGRANAFVSCSDVGNAVCEYEGGKKEKKKKKRKKKEEKKEEKKESVRKRNTAVFISVSLSIGTYCECMLWKFNPSRAFLFCLSQFCLLIYDLLCYLADA